MSGSAVTNPLSPRPWRRDWRSPAADDRPRGRAAAAARHWLCRTCPPLPGDEEPTSELLATFIGLHLCDVLEGLEGSADTSHLGEMIRDAVAQGGLGELWERCGAARVLLTQTLMRRYGLYLDDADDLAGETASVLSDLGQNRPDELTASWLLLRRLGYDPGPAAPPYLDLDEASHALFVLLADSRMLARVHESITAATQYGTMPVRGPADLVENLRMALPPVMLQLLRSEEIPTGAMLARSLVYLGLWNSPGLASAARMLEAQQRPDGAFGFGPPPTGELSGPEEAAEARRQCRAMTVECLWALAEITVPGFRLIPQTPGAL